MLFTFGLCSPILLLVDCCLCLTLRVYVVCAVGWFGCLLMFLFVCLFIVVWWFVCGCLFVLLIVLYCCVWVVFYFFGWVFALTNCGCLWLRFLFVVSVILVAFGLVVSLFVSWVCFGLVFALLCFGDLAYL